MRSQSHFRRWLKHKRIAFDTSFLIPLLEDTEAKEKKVTRIFRLLERGRRHLITSTVTLVEILVHPYRQKDQEAVNRYFGYLTRQPFLELVPLSPEIADRAADLRARYGFKTPDAIQIATALASNATLLLTLDRSFRKQKEIEIGFL